MWAIIHKDDDRTYKQIFIEAPSLEEVSWWIKDNVEQLWDFFQPIVNVVEEIRDLKLDNAYYDEIVCDGGGKLFWYLSELDNKKSYSHKKDYVDPDNDITQQKLKRSKQEYIKLITDFMSDLDSEEIQAILNFYRKEDYYGFGCRISFKEINKNSFMHINLNEKN
jgi:hypothetical protein